MGNPNTTPNVYIHCNYISKLARFKYNVSSEGTVECKELNLSLLRSTYFLVT